MSNDEPETSTEDGQSALNSFVSCCLTCDDWLGDKKKQIDEIKEKGVICMDKEKGWPESGRCNAMYEWADLQVVGDAYATLEIESNFGCNRHVADS